MPAAARSRIRLDQLLLERGLAESRARAQALVLAGRVAVGHGDAARRDLKAGDLVDRSAELVLAPARDWVSRGAHKLVAALDAFGVDPAGLVGLDVGASTGGFTEVLLARGARSVAAVDVGRGQLALRLRDDPRVVLLERTNARSLGPELLPEPAGIAVVDVSFISLALVLGPVASCLLPGAPIVALVKPQFEAGPADARGGVVRDPAVHRRVLDGVAAHARAIGRSVTGVVASPIRGPEGNREFLVRIEAAEEPADLGARFDDAVRAAWETP